MKYYIVGTHWGGTDMTAEFCQGDYWQMGYTDAEQPRFAKIRNGIQPGDRIALKSITGYGARTICIRAIGIVEANAGNCLRIRWVATDMDRIVPSHGCYATIHGPYTRDNHWIRDVFCL